MGGKRYRVVAGAAVASAALLWAASPSVGVWWLAWFAVAPAAWAALTLPGRAGRIAVPLALALHMETQLVPDLPFGIADGQWGDPPLPILIGGSPVLVVALIAVPLFGAILYMLPLAPGPGRPAVSSILVPALALAALEFARANLDPGGLWGTLSLTQAGAPGGNIAAIGGPWLLAGLIAAVGYAIALAIARRSIRLLAFPAGGLATAFAVAALATTGTEVRKIHVAAVQPGYDTAEEEPDVLRRWEPGSYPEAALDVIGDLRGPTARAARAGAELVAWPEATSFEDPADDPLIRRLVSSIARELGVIIVFPHFDHDTSTSAVSVVDEAGTFSPPLPKQRAMWFLGENAEDAPPTTVGANSLTIGTLLGIDTQDADIAAELAEQDADLLVSATHDWEEMATQHFAQARLLAQATGTGLVRADWRYDSAITAPDGGILAQAGGGKRRELVMADVPSAQPTWYTTIGPLFGWLSVASLAVLGAWRALGLGRRKTGWAPRGRNAP